MRMIRTLILASTLALAATGSALAQGAGLRAYGTIDRFDGKVLALTTDEGEALSVAMPDGVAVTALAERKLSDIQPGDYVGSAAKKGPDGKLHALEVHIFRPDQRGAGEGHRPMDAPDTTMTNAAVEGLMTSGEGGTLHLTYKGGDQTIVVDPGTRVVSFIPGDRALLVPGATVRIFGAPGTDGGVVARSIQAEKDGVKPLR